MRLSSSDVNQQTFRVSFRGFDPVEVDGFLKRVSDEIDRLHEEKANLEIELDLERVTRKSIEEALEATARLHESTVARAKEEAGLIIRQAELDAMKITSSAREELALLKRELAELEMKKCGVLAELSSFAYGVGEWVRRFDAGGEKAQSAGLPAKEKGLREEAPVKQKTPLVDDERAGMLMDMITDPDSFRPREEEDAEGGPSPSTDSEHIEIIDDIMIDEDKPR